MSNRNAYAGRNCEHLFANSIKDHPSVLSKIQNAFAIEGRFLNAICTGIHAEKVDAKLEYASGRNVDANIKAYKDSMGLNQITRSSIRNFCEKFSFDETVKSKIEALTINKARNTKSLWIPKTEQEYFINILKPKIKEIIKQSLSVQSCREILVLYNRTDGIMHIYTMKDVLRKLEYTISFTPKGNILIGKYIILKRKGGNGVHAENIRKDDIRHPGNNLQLHLHVIPFVRDMCDIELCNYRI